MDAIHGDAPFIMHEDGLGWLFVPQGLKDGPLPVHFEPVESVVRNRLHPSRPFNPGTDLYRRPDNVLAAPVDKRFPYVLTTYRLTEQHTAGGMSRWLHHLAELQPAMFCELSVELAAALRLANGDWMTLITLRGAIEARALVTRRMRPLVVQGQVVHQVAVPFHYGSSGLVTGDAANDLIPLLSEPNVHIHESKALTCAIRGGRRPRGRALLRMLEEFAQV
jgi:formate dehydrogenase major subunit